MVTKCIDKVPLSTGFKGGLPIGLGYFPVSFTFGFLTVAGGLPLWARVLISVTKPYKRGAVRRMDLILAGAGCEIA